MGWGHRCWKFWPAKVNHLPFPFVKKLSTISYTLYWWYQISRRYLSIVKEEGLEISQPALDPRKSEVHHPLTVRIRGSKVHRLTNLDPSLSLLLPAFSVNTLRETRIIYIRTRMCNMLGVEKIKRIENESRIEIIKRVWEKNEQRYRLEKILSKQVN